MDPEPWPDKYVHVKTPAIKTIEQFEEVLRDASDESPLQIFLRDHPELLVPIVPAGNDRWIWDRPKLGNQYIPDFLICYRNSAGYHWLLVELESPREKALNRNGLVAKKLNEAMTQIKTWRIWLRQNISYAHSELGLKGINAESSSLVVIGRRDMLAIAQIGLYNELSMSPKNQVMTYDRLLEVARARAE